MQYIFLLIMQLHENANPSMNKQTPPSTPLGPVEQSIAKRISELRSETGLTLKELGLLSGLSNTYLSRVENGQTSITIASLSRIAEAFATPLASFFEEADIGQPLEICRGGKGPKARFRGRSGTLVSLLAQGKPNKLMEPLIVNLTESPPAILPQGHSGEELNYVLEGKCKFIYGTDTYELQAGDSAYFDAVTPHAIHAIDDSPSRILVVVTSKDFQAHTDISKIIERRVQI